MKSSKLSSSVSKTVQTYLIMPQHLNAAGRLFGGQLLSWIDMTAGIVALRHCDCNVVTACIDHLEFKDYALATDVVTLIGEVTYTGTSSMEIIPKLIIETPEQQEEWDNAVLRNKQRKQR